MAVRVLAGKLDVNLSVVKGGGPDGVAKTADVERAVSVLASAAPPNHSAVSVSPWRIG